MAETKHPVLEWSWRLVLALFCISALLGWIQCKRSRTIYTPLPVTKQDWDSAKPVDFSKGDPGAYHPDFVRMLGRRQVGEGHVPALRIPLAPRSWGYVLHVGIHRTDRRVARLEVVLNGTVLGTHEADFHRRADIFEVLIPGKLLAPGEDSWLTIRNAGSGAWFGRMVVIPYGSLRKPLQMLLPLSGFLLLLLGGIRQHLRGRYLWTVVLGVVVFFVYLHTMFASKMTPMAGIAFSDPDELVRPFLTNTMEYDLTKHMLCLPVIHLLWRVFRAIGWAEMVALAGAFAFVAAANVTVAHLLFRRWVRRGVGAMLLTLCYAGSFSIWLYSSIFETFIFSSLMTNLFLLLWLSSRGSRSLGRACLESGGVVLCGLAHPPLLVFLGAILHQWFRMWRQRAVVMTLLGAVLLVVMTCGGFLGGRFLIRHAYIAGTEELGTVSVQDEYADAGKMVDLYASTDNITWNNAGNIVLGQCVYAVAGREPMFDYTAGWAGAKAYLGRPTGWVSIAALLVLSALAVRGMVLRRTVLYESLSLAAVVVLPYMLFFLWFNPGEMLLYSPPMMAVMFGWLAWAGRPGAPRLFDVTVAVLAGTVICANTVVIMAFH